MTTKTMDSESYLENLESADKQNYWVTDIDVTHSEYIKKSDVLQIISTKKPNLAIAEIKKMQEEYIWNQTITDSLIVCALQEAIYRIEALDNGWVKCSDRFPDNKGNYICYSDYWVTECVFSLLYKKWYDPVEEYEEYNVTHWMHLPKLPKK